MEINIIFLAIFCVAGDLQKYFETESKENGHVKGDVILHLPPGKIKGQTRTTITGTTFYSFQGVPFAEPPVNHLRFQAPLPKKSWDGVIDATHEGNVCYQMTVDRSNESEDCLFINIFTPKHPLENASLPVMFFIHGGGFIEGSSEEVIYGPNHFMDYQVIIVTFNYRLGPFGFFSTGDDVIPGNAGLKDQVLALKWTNQNIQYFGGDSNKITIFGQSAGAASVAYHIISPKSKGLFRAAICESGSALSPWAYQRDQVKISYQVASFINDDYKKHNGSSKDLLQYIQSVSAKEIDRAAHKQYLMESPNYNQIQQGFYFAPIIEHEHKDAFITRRMYDILKKGDINNISMMTGVNSEECFYYNADAQFTRYTRAFTKNNLLLVPNDMHVTNQDDKEKVADMLQNYYAPSQPFTDNKRSLIKYFSDQGFARSIIKQAELQSKVADVYFYQFSYHGVLGGYTNKSVNGFSEDVRHGEELSYLFRRTYGGFNNTDLTKYPKSDRVVQKRMITMFTNFAKYLNPTPEKTKLLQYLTWPKVDPISFQYLAIGPWFEIKQHPKRNMYENWGRIYFKYAIPPYDTY